eukprot:SAG22_NODE_889_length_6648_cov_6.695984_6_plen_147_part_00
MISTLDPKQDTHVGEDLMSTGCWEPVMTPLFLHAVDLIKKNRLTAGDTKRPALLDIGANHGWFTNLGAAAGLAVAAFEPVPEHCEKVRQRCVRLSCRGRGAEGRRLVVAGRAGAACLPACLPARPHRFAAPHTTPPPFLGPRSCPF